MNNPNFFDEGSPYLQHPLLTAGRTANEVDFLLSQLRLPLGATVLDIGCGFGRHSIELAHRGYQVTGIDPSAAMVRAARKRAAESSVSVQFMQSSGESLVTETGFDAAICLFTTLGQISKGGDNSALLRRAYTVLKPGGRLVVEVPQRKVAVAELKATDRFGGAEEYTAVDRCFDAETNTVKELFTIVSAGATRSYLLLYRLYDRVELTRMLEQASFTVVACYAGYEELPLHDESPTMLLIGRK